jgi:hypothetical protein
LPALFNQLPRAYLTQPDLLNTLRNILWGLLVRLVLKGGRIVQEERYPEDCESVSGMFARRRIVRTTMYHRSPTVRSFPYDDRRQKHPSKNAGRICLDRADCRSRGSNGCCAPEEGHVYERQIEFVDIATGTE